ncbi:transcriptional regulator, TetR family [Rhodococcus wratislaviensis]|uniref:Transcriptional regulator, TetR family n=1 Tax=Rhodococcus wratislaviensis TaxID=44752 RepID=A0A402CLA4_RHOWR|nr:transcriptional regulator, TetR family [Rhodococcus wratislaviensis]
MYHEAFATMRAILDAAATAAGQSVGPETIDELTYLVSTLSDGFALNWLVFTDRTAAELQIEHVLGVLDAWMATNLGAASVPARRVSTVPPAVTLRSLASWVSVD